MNLLRKIQAKFNKKQHNIPTLVDVSNRAIGEEIHLKLAELEKPVALLKPKPRGRVIKQTRHSEFNPNPQRTGGRIVKVMPKQLQKIKAAQEKVEDDDQPSVTDLEE